MSRPSSTATAQSAAPDLTGPGINSGSAPPPDDDSYLNPKVAVSCFDFLLIELVPLAQRMAEQLHAHEVELRQGLQQARAEIMNANDESSAKASNAVEKSSGVAASVAGTVATNTTSRTTASSVPYTSTRLSTDPGLVDDGMREAVFWRLDGLGYRVGQGLVEKFSAGKPRPGNPLDAIKFICKDLWILVFRKQIDNLKTNHRGVFVLTDARFQPLSRMSVDRRHGAAAGVLGASVAGTQTAASRKAIEETLRRAQTYLCFPSGIIRGALTSLGMEIVSVVGETAELPTAVFHIRMKGART